MCQGLVADSVDETIAAITSRAAAMAMNVAPYCAGMSHEFTAKAIVYAGREV